MFFKLSSYCPTPVSYRKKSTDSQHHEKNVLNRKQQRRSHSVNTQIWDHVHILISSTRTEPGNHQLSFQWGSSSKTCSRNPKEEKNNYYRKDTEELKTERIRISSFPISMEGSISDWFWTDSRFFSCSAKFSIKTCGTDYCVKLFNDAPWEW